VVELLGLGVALAHQLLTVLHDSADAGLVVTNLARQHLVLFQQQVHRLATGTSIGLKYTGILLCSVSDLDLGSGVPFLPLDPGWVKNQDPDSGSYFRELRNNFVD